MKRKVILYISQSLDGYIADENGNVDWIKGNDESYISDYGYANFIKNIDVIIMGYNTYHQIANELSKNEWVYKGVQTYVLTHKKLNDLKDISFVEINIKELIDDLKKEPGKNIWICGGSNVVGECMKNDLIDEYCITTIPVLLGKGIRLFEGSNVRYRLKLKDIQEENGLITASYIRKNEDMYNGKTELLLR